MPRPESHPRVVLVEAPSSLTEAAAPVPSFPPPGEIRKDGVQEPSMSVTKEKAGWAGSGGGRPSEGAPPRRQLAQGRALA